MLYNDRKIEKAFRLLEEAQEKKERELKQPPQFTPFMEDMVAGAVGKMTKSAYNVKSAIQTGQEKSRAVIDKVERRLYRDPWKFVGQVALWSFAIGFILGAHQRYSSQPRKRKRYDE